MKLLDYFKAMNIPINLFAKESKISYQQINRLCNFQCVPTLKTAMLIERLTEGVVDAWDLLSPDVQQEINEYEKNK